MVLVYSSYVFPVLPFIALVRVKATLIGEELQDSFSISEEKFINRPKFNFRSSDFAEIVTTAAFVDKSMFIKTFVEDRGVVVITAPKHFGKSTNINMLKRFLEIEVDDEGETKTNCTNIRHPIRDTVNYNLFVDNRLKITEDKTFMDCYFGKHPVIHVDMEFSNIHVMSYDIALDQMKYIVHCSFVEHHYLKRSNKLNSAERTTVNNWCSTSGYSQMSEADLSEGLQLLSRFLYHHYENRRVYVLIDNFDSPEINALLFAQTEDIMGGIYRLVSSIIINVLHKNFHAHRGLISGMSYIAGSPSLYSLGYVHVCRFLEDHSYAGFHGLTQQEATQLFSSDRFNLSSELICRIETTYGGYKSYGNVTLYNLWSVIHLLLYLEVRDYWEGPGIPLNLENLLRVPALRNEITLLSEGRERKAQVKKIYAPDDVIRLRDLVRKPEFHHELHYMDMVLTLLGELGYLTVVPSSHSFTGRHFMKIPNKEIMRRILETTKKYKNYYSTLDKEETVER